MFIRPECISVWVKMPEDEVVTDFYSVMIDCFDEGERCRPYED